MSFHRSLVVTTFLITSALLPIARAETIAVIGTGEVGASLGPRFAAVGHDVVYGSRSPERDDVRQLVRDTGRNASAATPAEAAARADIVVLAVPWNAIEEVVRSLGDLSGKIVIDPTNPRIIAEDGFRDFPSHTSNAERIQALAPEAFVVKAFNTISDDTMRDPDMLGFQLAIPIVGNDGAAKDTVAELVEAMGYRAVDVGPIRYAHIVEGLYLLRSNARDLLDAHYEYALPLRENPIPQAID